jgi:hypothetical protein
VVQQCPRTDAPESNRRDHHTRTREFEPEFQPFGARATTQRGKGDAGKYRGAGPTNGWFDLCSLVLLGG